MLNDNLICETIVSNTRYSIRCHHAAVNGANPTQLSIVSKQMLRLFYIFAAHMCDSATVHWIEWMGDIDQRQLCCDRKWTAAMEWKHTNGLALTPHWLRQRLRSHVVLCVRVWYACMCAEQLTVWRKTEPINFHIPSTWLIIFRYVRCRGRPKNNQLNASETMSCAFRCENCLSIRMNTNSKCHLAATDRRLILSFRIGINLLSTFNSSLRLALFFITIHHQNENIMSTQRRQAMHSIWNLVIFLSKLVSKCLV